MPPGQSYNQFYIVGSVACPCTVRRLIAPNGAAQGAAMRDDISFFRIGLG